MIKAFLDRLFSCEKMVKPQQIKGPIPPSKSIYARAIDIAWPSALESVLVGLVSSIDTIMVGTLGPEAIAAVGITTQPRFIFLAIIFSLNAGVTTVVARRRGEQDVDGANRCLHQSLVLCVILSIISAGAGVLFAQPMMQFAGAQSDILKDATVYFQIVMAGTLFSNISMTINAAQRGVGNTRISMVSNLTANGVNLVFNYILINGKFGFPRLGIVGAAIATTIGAVVSLVVSLSTVVGYKGFLNCSLHDNWRFDKKTMGAIWKIWSGALAEQMVSRFGFFAYAKIVANLGTLAFAAHQVCMNVMNLTFNLGGGFSTAVSSLVGQSLGEKRPDMAKIYVKVTNVLTGIVAISCGAALIIFRVPIVRLFTDNVQIVPVSANIVAMIGLFMLLQTTTDVFSGCLRGAGDARFIAVMSLICIGVIRPASAWVLCTPLQLGLYGAWGSFFLDQFLRWVLVSHRMRKDKWSEIVV